MRNKTISVGEGFGYAPNTVGFVATKCFAFCSLDVPKKQKSKSVGEDAYILPKKNS